MAHSTLRLASEGNDRFQAPSRLAYCHMTVDTLQYVSNPLAYIHIKKSRNKDETSDQRQARAPTSPRACNPIACHVVALTIYYMRSN